MSKTFVFYTLKIQPLVHFNKYVKLVIDCGEGYKLIEIDIIVQQSTLSVGYGLTSLLVGNSLLKIHLSRSRTL